MIDEGKASAFYIRAEDPLKFQEAVRSEIHAAPAMSEYDVRTIEELFSTLTPEKMPGFTIGLRIVTGMLKSMGASRLYIIAMVLRETGLLTIVGIILGIAGTNALRSALQIKLPTQAFSVTPGWGGIRCSHRLRRRPPRSHLARHQGNPNAM